MCCCILMGSSICLLEKFNNNSWPSFGREGEHMYKSLMHTCMALQSSCPLFYFGVCIAWYIQYFKMRIIWCLRLYLVNDGKKVIYKSAEEEACNEAKLVCVHMQLHAACVAKHKAHAKFLICERDSLPQIYGEASMQWRTCEDLLAEHTRQYLLVLVDRKDGFRP